MEKKRFIAHLRGNGNGDREATVVGLWDEELERMDFGIAIKNPRDKNYNKSLGVSIAEGRATKRPNFRVNTELVPEINGRRDMSKVFSAGVKRVKSRLERKWSELDEGGMLIMFTE